MKHQHEQVPLNPTLTINFARSVLKLSFHQLVGFPSGRLPTTLPTTLYVIHCILVRATYSAHSNLLHYTNFNSIKWTAWRVSYKQSKIRSPHLLQLSSSWQTLQPMWILVRSTIIFHKSLFNTLFFQFVIFIVCRSFVTSSSHLFFYKWLPFINSCNFSFFWHPFHMA
jgi:hypothetical protein